MTSNTQTTPAPPVPPAPRSSRPSGRAAAGRAVVLGPGAVLLIVFAVLPLIALLWTGFTVSGGGLTLTNFSQVFDSDIYTSLLWRTLGVALLVTLLSIALGWPAAWALARYTPPRRRALILGLVIIPYITSQLLLIYGFITLIQPDGPLMSVLHSLRLASATGSILYTPTATVLMLIYESLPTAVLVMFAASEQVDESLLEAARSLGAGRVRVFMQVIWPLATTMLIANFALTFVQTVGAFAEPSLLGGPSGQLVGNVIAEQLNTGFGRQFAVALSLVLLVASLLIVSAFAGLVMWTRSLQSGTRSGSRLLRVRKTAELKGQVNA